MKPINPTPAEAAHNLCGVIAALSLKTMTPDPIRIETVLQEHSPVMPYMLDPDVVEGLREEFDFLPRTVHLVCEHTDYGRSYAWMLATVRPGDRSIPLIDTIARYRRNGENFEAFRKEIIDAAAAEKTEIPRSCWWVVYPCREQREAVAQQIAEVQEDE